MGMNKVTENRHEVWKVACQVTFIENISEMVAEIWRPGIDGGILKWVILDPDVSVVIGFTCLAVNVLSQH
jgi:hypothetical protein